ncbi:MAG: hypothetical protein EPN82_11175 [Bacteroidetes bacterium]|nr:MAG: hypothetical protein EPN82_11175 [Bacteroidota bacterium]
MKKLFLFLLLNINLLLIPLSSNAREDLGLGLNYNYFNKQNQIVASASLCTRYLFFSEPEQFCNIAVGIRTYNDKSPYYIYHLTLFKTDAFRAILNEEGIPLRPGYTHPSIWGFIYGITLLDIDKTQIENSLIQWLQVRGGFGTHQLILSNINELNFHGFMALKLGISSINFGGYNFKNINDNTKNRIGIESGFNLVSDFSYNKDINLQAKLDYSLLISDDVIQMLTGGIYLVYNLRIKEGYKSDLMNFLMGANYYYYFLENINKEFIKYEIGINCHFTTSILPRF